MITLNTLTSVTTSNNIENIGVRILREEYCQPLIRRGILWNWTRFEENDIRPCPDGSSGLAQFECTSTGRWSENGPNLGSCKSLVIAALEDRVRKQDPEDIIIERLAHLTKSRKRRKYYGGDVDGAVAIIRTLTSRLQYLFQTESDHIQNKKPYMQDFFQNIVRSVSNLIAKDMMPSWMDLEVDRRMNIVTNLLSALDESAFLLADVINNPEILEEASPNIGKVYYII